MLFGCHEYVIFYLFLNFIFLSTHWNVTRSKQPTDSFQTDGWQQLLLEDEGCVSQYCVPSPPEFEKDKNIYLCNQLQYFLKKQQGRILFFLPQLLHLVLVIAKTLTGTTVEYVIIFRLYQTFYYLIRISFFVCFIWQTQRASHMKPHEAF